ncbi:phosphoribosyl-ATP diphosphatase [Brackiella oedipodis]|uniref:phosphoribosyl-ATP diphosphatase n=1 Tax=Brackiella oedipodis TaxID=124225 RepID=UPI00048BB2E4|nr:phosphoribosyl-ATP diphosphatase [Brackiella oedipodis]
MSQTPSDFLEQLCATLQQRLPAKGGDPKQSYVAKLLANGPDAFLKKIAEESGELIMACKDQKNDKIIYEVADLWFHSLVALTYYGLSASDIIQELSRREGTSGLAEKAARQSTGV